MNRSIVLFVILATTAVLSGGCAAKVQRVKVDKQVDLSGRWNDTDARQVSESMIADCTKQAWQPMFLGENKRLPVIIVGAVRNQSTEHINTEVFTKSLERSLLNSGKAKFVANKVERPQVREEREDQQMGDTDPATIRQMGREIGADYMLIGSINAIKDETKGRYVIFYQISLELVDIQTNDKVWIGEENIKKIVEKNKYSL
jgi:uncharacterized protein (TIGR02722 family)